MKSHRSHVLLLATILLVGSVPVRASKETPQGVPTNVTLWDTGKPLGDTIDLANRAQWKVVPPNLLLLEADPLKSSSDPGYYGREYAFQGDAVVENSYLTAVVWSAKKTVVVFSKNSKFEIPHTMSVSSRCTVLQNTGDDVALEVFFSKGDESALGVTDVLTFNKTPIIEIKPGEPKAILTPVLKQVGVAPAAEVIRLSCEMEYVVVPGFIGDDLILSPTQYPSDQTLSLPTENVLLGLLKGENSALVITWPRVEKQWTRFRRSEKDQEVGLFLNSRGQSMYVALLDAPGIWHRESLGVSYLEKDVASKWKKPFPAKWVTPLWEGDVRTTYTFRTAPAGTIWRGVAGMYSYPIWFNGDNAWYHLSKKVLPKGESIVYFLEGQGTPASILTPVDIMKATLGRQTCDSILDVAGQKLRTHHRRGAEGIRRACTCGCTEAIEAVFKAGQEIEKKEYIEGAVGDMVFFVTEHMKRLNEYRSFADEMLKFLRTAAGAQPELKTYLDSLTQIVQSIPEQYEVQKENIKSLEYTDELSRKTLALLRNKHPQNLSACLDLGKDWRGMGGAQDGLLAEYHIIVRKLFQEAGYGCVTQPKAVDLAREIRNRCRQCLRNPDGYEIWANY